MDTSALAAPPTSNCPLFPARTSGTGGGLAASGRELRCTSSTPWSRQSCTGLAEYLGCFAPYNGVVDSCAAEPVVLTTTPESDHVPSDPEPSEGREWQRPASADVGHGGLPAVQAVQRPPRRPAAGVRDPARPGTWARTRSAERLDQRQCRRPAHPARPGAAVGHGGAILHAITSPSMNAPSAHIYPARHHAGAGGCAACR